MPKQKSLAVSRFRRMTLAKNGLGRILDLAAIHVNFVKRQRLVNCYSIELLNRGNSIDSA